MDSHLLDPHMSKSIHSLLFWEIAKEVGNEIVVGVDAHKPTDFISTPYKDVNEFIKTLGLKVNKDFRI